MFIRFIGHAGVYIEEGDSSLFIDAWFQDSTLDKPIIESLSGVKSIDFQIPKTREKIGSYQPDALVISHLHPHHSSIADIRQLIGQSEKSISLFYPASETIDVSIREKFAEYRNLSIKNSFEGETATVGSLTIKAISHTVPDHLAWYVESKTGSVLHIADSRVHDERSTRRLDPVWEKFSNMRPDLIFMSAGRNSFRLQNENGKKIYENACLSPIEAARVLQKISPSVVSLIGNHNHSIWKNRVEFIPEISTNEEEFAWALEWLLPEAKFVRARAGHTYALREPERTADTHIR